MKPLALEPRSAYLDSGQVVVYHAIGSGPPILFCNGLAAGIHGYREQIAHLSARYRCLVWDYRGLRRDSPPLDISREPAPTLADHTREAIAIAEQESDGAVAVVGWSYGVTVALEMFAQTPRRVASLVLVNGGARASWTDASAAGPIRRHYARLVQWLSRAPELVERLFAQAAHSPEAVTWARRLGLVGAGIDPDLLTEVFSKFQEIDVRALVGMVREMGEVDQRPLLGRVDVPTLVIGGGRDPFTSRATLEHLVHSVAGAEYLLLPGGTHYVLMDHAEHVNLRIEKFFSERGYE